MSKIVRSAILAACLWLSGNASASTLAEMQASCAIGTSPTPDGSMPTSVSGVLVVSPKEAKCVLDAYKDIVVIAPMGDIMQLPGAVPILTLGTAAESHDSDARFTPLVTKLTEGNLDRPILTYCHHTSCGLSYNAAIHLRRLGYRNILWMREGSQGWSKAGYPYAKLNEVQAPLDQPTYVFWFNASRGYTYGCFGEKNADACNLKLAMLELAANDPGVTEKEKPIVLGELFNTGAVRAENLRAAGKAREGYDAVKPIYDTLLDYADAGAKTGVISENAKVVREMALASMEIGRPQDAERYLAFVRKDVGLVYKGLPALAQESDARKSAQSAMVSMEHLENELATYAAAKAKDLLTKGDQAGAQPWMDLLNKSVDGTMMWIDRNSKEGVKHFMDGAPLYRMGKVKELQALLLDQSGDRKSALTALSIATNAYCSQADPQGFQELISGKEVTHGPWHEAHACYTAQLAYLKMDGTVERWAADVAKKQYDYYMSMLKD